ncbi:TRAP transporter substrate-binding protein [Celeribacter indicus]|uniref:TRAP dicarboxylate transporter subunit DctP n=1 Tax=Celeribacter indicus TaxID=1208324 RepID=A0A0B5E053_9RHOB|nr:TRAP transporter substrate-binding protein DctP [Celeribacter indicus]AJE46765.1 TRAP dicarboxylate transporter subunit DctP [Celeribacter indicus]SDX05871.1 TRAP-type C4-dicarboxylate transport system, substrate-binding protein [Celeribacter indicus]
MKLWPRAVAGLTGAVIALGFGAAEAKSNWTFFGNMPRGNAYGQAMAAGFERIREKTDGELNIRYVFFGETPYKHTEALNLMKDGLTQMVEWSPALTSATYPAIGASELPFLIPSMSDAQESLEKMNAVWDSEAYRTAVDDIVSANGAVALARHYYPPMNLWVADEDLEDMFSIRGQKIRTINAEYGILLEEVGASPVTMTSPEVYEALQRNVMSGVLTGSPNIIQSKWNEVLNSVYVANMSLPASFLLIREDMLDSLPEDQRTILEEEMEVLGEDLRRVMWETDTSTLARLEEEDFTVVEATDEDYARLREIAQTKIWPAWVRSAGDEGQALLDAALGALGE